MKKEIIRNIAGVILFYLLIIYGVISLNSRFEEINKNNYSSSLHN